MEIQDEVGGGRLGEERWVARTCLAGDDRGCLQRTKCCAELVQELARRLRLSVNAAHAAESIEQDDVRAHAARLVEYQFARRLQPLREHALQAQKLHGSADQILIEEGERAHVLDELA